MISYRLYSLTAVCLLAWLSVSCELAPQIEILTQNLSSRVVKTNNEDDYAYVYTLQVRNKGGAGKIRAKGRINTPQGQFYREQVVELDRDEAKTLEFIYTEPDFIAELFAEAKSTSTYEFSYDVVR